MGQWDPSDHAQAARIKLYELSNRYSSLTLRSLINSPRYTTPHHVPTMIAHPLMVDTHWPEPNRYPRFDHHHSLVDQWPRVAPPRAGWQRRREPSATTGSRAHGATTLQCIVHLSVRCYTMQRTTQMQQRLSHLGFCSVVLRRRRMADMWKLSRSGEEFPSLHDYSCLLLLLPQLPTPGTVPRPSQIF